MATGKITKRSVDAAIGGGQTFLWDTELKGFGIRVTKAGASYLVQYRMGGRETSTRRYSIGRHGSPWTPDRARERAADLLEMVRRGIDPAEKERQEAEAAAREAQTASGLGFSKHADTYLSKRVAGQRRAREVARIFERDLKPHFGSTPLPDIRKADVVALLDKVGVRNGSAANKAHSALKTFFRWATERDTIQHSPMEGLRKPDPAASEARDHVLREDEIRLVWLASFGLPPQFGGMVRFLILTGQRLREVAGISWNEIDETKREWTLPGERTKNGKAHVIPLSEHALQILKDAPAVKSERKLIFTTTGKAPVSGFSKAKAELDKLVVKLAAKEAQEAGEAEPMTIEPWRYHDLRRTLATSCERLGVPIAVTEAILNHVSGSKRGIVSVYQRHAYLDEKRVALDRWAAEVARIVGGAGEAAPVIDLQQAREAKAG